MKFGYSILKWGFAFIAALGTATAAAQTIKIGLLSTFSGPQAQYGEQIERGVRLYMKLNADRLPPGVKVEIIVRDDGGPNPDNAKRLAQELIVRDKINFLTGLNWTPNTLAIAPLINQAKVPSIIMNAAASVITTRSPYFVRFSFTEWQAGYTMGKWASKRYKRAFTLVSDFSPGHDSEQAFEKGFTEGGGQIIGKTRTPVLNFDFLPFIQRVKDAKPDALFVFVPAGQQSVQIMKSFRDLDLDKEGIKLIGSGNITTDEELPNMDDSAIGVVTSFHYSFSGDRPANKLFRELFAKEYGNKVIPSLMTIAAWDGMDAIYAAIRAQGGRIDPDRTMELLRNYKNPNSPRGPISIDPETRDIVQNMYIREVRRVGGQLANVEIDVFPNVKDPWKELNRVK